MKGIAHDKEYNRIYQRRHAVNKCISKLQHNISEIDSCEPSIIYEKNILQAKLNYNLALLDLMESRLNEIRAEYGIIVANQDKV